MARCRVLLLTILLSGLALWAAFSGSPNDFRFAILGDRTTLGSQTAYEQIWKEIDALHPAFVVNVGDSIAGRNDATAPAEWAALRAFWKQYPYQLFLVPGNHDIWNDSSRQLWQKEAGRPAFYSFDYQNAHFTVLDNSGSLTLGADQLRFLEQDLQTNAARAPKFVLFHQPFWIPFLKLGSGEFDLHRIARRYAVNCVLSGHGHQLVRGERDGVVYLEVGSSGADMSSGIRRGAGRAEGWFYQHVQATVKGASVKLEVKELGGSTFPVEKW